MTKGKHVVFSAIGSSECRAGLGYTGWEYNEKKDLSDREHSGLGTSLKGNITGQNITGHTAHWEYYRPEYHRAHSPLGILQARISQGTQPTGNITLGISQGTQPTGNITLGISQGTQPAGNITLGISQGTQPTGNITGQNITGHTAHWVYYTGNITGNTAHWVYYTGNITGHTAHWVYYTGNTARWELNNMPTLQLSSRTLHLVSYGLGNGGQEGEEGGRREGGGADGLRVEKVGEGRRELTKGARYVVPQLTALVRPLPSECRWFERTTLLALPLCQWPARVAPLSPPYPPPPPPPLPPPP